MAEHSPLPWSLDIEGDDYSVRDARTITLINDTSYYPSAPDREDAAFIVKAVNMHQELVAALRLALPWVSPPLDDRDMSASGVAHRAIVAALAKLDV